MWFGKPDMLTLENYLWEAVCSIRGSEGAPKYKDYIIPLIFYKRLCDVFENEVFNGKPESDKILSEFNEK